MFVYKSQLYPITLPKICVCVCVCVWERPLCTPKFSLIPPYRSPTMRLWKCRASLAGKTLTSQRGGSFQHKTISSETEPKCEITVAHIHPQSESGVETILTFFAYHSPTFGPPVLPEKLAPCQRTNASTKRIRRLENLDHGFGCPARLSVAMETPSRETGNKIYE